MVFHDTGGCATTAQVVPPSGVTSSRSGAYQSSVETRTWLAFWASMLSPPAMPPQLADGGVTFVHVPLADSFQICPDSVPPPML